MEGARRVGVIEDVIFHHVPERASSDEGWVKRMLFGLVWSGGCVMCFADVLGSMTVYMMWNRIEFCSLGYGEGLGRVFACAILA